MCSDYYYNKSATARNSIQKSSTSPHRVNIGLVNLLFFNLDIKRNLLLENKYMCQRLQNTHKKATGRIIA